jgi:thioredoxin 1
VRHVCEKIAPEIEALSKEYKGRAIVGKINVNENSRIPVQFGIRNIPTLLFFKDGKLVEKQVGAVSRSVLASKLEAQLNKTGHQFNNNPNTKAMALEFTDSNFEELVIKSDKPVLVDFWAEWCGPCRMVGPVVEELAKEYEGKAVIGKVNVDHNPNISTQFGIRNIPTLLFFKGGQLVDKQVGAVPKSVLAGKLDAQLK